MSPISSRNSVPPLACSKRPLRSRSAPVNDAGSWPNSSSSSRFSLRAVQFMATNGLFLRGLLLWMRLGDELLAGAGLALDQHGGARSGRCS